jgi:hypothetical protein
MVIASVKMVTMIRVQHRALLVTILVQLAVVPAAPSALRVEIIL